MQPIEFDIESARAAKQVMTDTYWNLIEDLQNLIAEVWGLEDDWIAPSADQFQMEFEDFKTQLRTNMDPLWILINRLGAEIAQWEEASSKLE
jgi:hypothetical protein